jgi:diphthine-ammonia ligase
MENSLKESNLNEKNYVVSWSGGKDGCMACYRALERGCKITKLVNFISDKPHKVRFHGMDAGLVQAQAQAMGIELLQKVASWEEYEKDFKETISWLKPQGVNGMVFGDIYLQVHLDWVQRVCGEIGVEALEPLWGRDTRELLNEFIDAGFEAVIGCVKTSLMGREWVGRSVDRSFMDYLGANGIDYCGEKGEFHTLVTGGPLFKKKIKLQQNGVLEHDGYCVLDVSKYELV